MDDCFIINNGTLVKYRGELKQTAVYAAGTLVAEVTERGAASVRSVTIPEGVGIIAAGAFEHCCNLEEAYLPKCGIRSMDADAFPRGVTLHVYYTSGLWRELFRVRWKMEYLDADIVEKNSSAILAMVLAFKGYVKLNLHLGNDIQDCEFENFPVGCAVTIEDDVYARHIFRGSNITDVSIGPFVQYLHPYAFKGSNELCSDTSLRGIHVAPKNEKFYSIDGVLFNRSDTLICYPQLRGDAGIYRIPETTKKVRDLAFWGAHLNALYIPYHTVLEERALFDMPWLKHVVQIGADEDV